MRLDSGTQLRELYKSQGGVSEIFSDKVRDYVTSRPDYPDALYAKLRELCAIGPGATVADVGSGTGLLTAGLLRMGCSVLAVEPNTAMRAAADQQLATHPGYQSAAGSAEAVPAQSSSIDLVTAAQAFHWFDVERARAEFLRVLRPAGQVALIWNDRVLSDPLHIALDEVFAQYGGARRGALLAHEERHNVPSFFGSTLPITLTWPHAHYLTASGLQSLVFSRSYMPLAQSPEGRDVADKVRQVFERFADGDRLVVHYTTVAIVGRPLEL